MRRLIISIIILPLYVLSQDNSQNAQLYLENYIDITSNSLNYDFANKILFQGKILDEDKNIWIDLLKEKNVINAELNTKLDFQIFNNKNTFLFSVSDHNMLNSSFSDDLFKLIFKGNYDFQGDTLSFNQSSFIAKRYQKIQIGYERDFKFIKITGSLAYLNGNHYYSLLSEQGNLYTETTGLNIFLEYDLNGFATNRNNLSLLANNGHGISGDLEFNYYKDDIQINWYLNNLGFIKWNENSLIYDIDSSFLFSGIQIDNFINFHDSLLEEEINNLENHISSGDRKSFKSYTTANFGFNAQKDIEGSLFEKVILGVNLKWRPNIDNLPIGWKKIKQGINESNYSPLYYISATYNYKYLYLAPEISLGGYTESYNLNLMIGLKIHSIFTRLKINNINELIQGNSMNSLNMYFQIGKNF